VLIEGVAVLPELLVNWKMSIIGLFLSRIKETNTKRTLEKVRMKTSMIGCDMPALNTLTPLRPL